MKSLKERPVTRERTRTTEYPRRNHTAQWKLTHWVLQTWMWRYHPPYRECFVTWEVTRTLDRHSQEHDWLLSNTSARDSNWALLNIAETSFLYTSGPVTSLMHTITLPTPIKYTFYIVDLHLWADLVFSFSELRKTSERQIPPNLHRNLCCKQLLTSHGAVVYKGELHHLEQVLNKEISI